MKFIKTPLKGLYVIESILFSDNRGIFQRVYCKNELEKANLFNDVVQVNHSINYKKGSVRGLHYQVPPKSEKKIIKCLRGKAFDVAVDIRHNSPTFLQWHAIELCAKKMNMVIIPEGFAHGFQTLENNTELLYFHSEFYTPEFERGLNCMDRKLNVIWPLEIAEISDRDKNHQFVDDNFYGIEL